MKGIRFFLFEKDLLINVKLIFEGLKTMEVIMVFFLIMVVEWRRGGGGGGR